MRGRQLEPAQFKELLSLLAHDLRNPLAALLTNINFVRGSIDRTGELEEALADAALSCNVLERLIANVDLLARGVAPGTFTVRSTRLRSAVGEAVARISAQAALVDVELRIVAGETDPVVLVEPEPFGRALDNLLSNALQYSPARTRVTIELSESDERGTVAILDRGPVVPAELREDVLSAIGQSRAKTRFEGRYGRGLGLFCASEAARLAGAAIVIGDRDGVATFELSAALAPDPSAKVAR